jgi:prolyl-tRNA synthetase
MMDFHLFSPLYLTGTMRLSQSLFVTLREEPAEAEIPSHKLLLRAGYIRRIGSGLYAYLPLMWRVLNKVRRIVQEEMDATGAQECLLPQLQPAELWQQSGRWDTYTQAEGIMFAFTDRQQREVALGPTHEEVITAVARDMIRSYRQLPQNLYQIQSKFRDEIRPRFGLMRGREFIMKDAYSFHANEESLKETYQEMAVAYSNMLRRCGLEFRAVDADSGAIGGSGSQEFMVLADAGEDDVLYTADGHYAANVEKAVSLPADAVSSIFTIWEEVATPASDTIEKLTAVLKCAASAIVKNVLYQATYDNGTTVIVLVSIRGDQKVNEVKLINELSKRAADYQAKTIIGLVVPDGEAMSKWVAQPLPLGYISPGIGDDCIKPGTVTAKILRLVDNTAASLTNFVTGADRAGYHITGANWNTDYPLPVQVDVRTALVGDRATHDSSQTLETARGIEVGHIFQLGTKYSEAMGATFTTEQGTEQPLVMGCYGVGVSRLAQAAVEQSYDKDGIIWPVAIAPYQVIICVPNVTDAAQMAAAEQLYQELNAAGIETILDDRDERAGVKFKDADLIGIPYRIVTGRSLQSGQVEVVTRSTKQSQEIPVPEVQGVIRSWIAASMG